MTQLAHFLPGRVSEVGKIKIGTLGAPTAGRNNSTYNPMIRLDQFLITTLDRDAGGVLIPDRPLMESLKEYRDKEPPHRLRTIPVMFLSNTISDVLQSRYEWWVGRSQLGAASSDLVVGDCPADPEEVKVTWFCDAKTGKPLPQPRTEPMTHEHVKLQIGAGEKTTSLFKLATTLSVMVASTAASFGGVYRFRTKGWHSSNQLLGSLQHIKRLTFGVLRGPVFSLVVQPKQVHGGGVTSTAQVVRVDIRGNDLKQLRDDAMAGVKYELDNLKAVQLVDRQYRALMAAPAEVLDDDAEPVALAELPPARGPVSDADFEREDLMEQIRHAAARRGERVDDATLRTMSLGSLRSSAEALTGPR
jgi:hypothetical protein